jgi:hypothetical protein
MRLEDALDRAIAAHAKWKYRLMDAIDSGKSDVHVSDVRSDTACEFGKWMAALPLADRLNQHVPEVRSLHTQFHALAADVLEMALAGDKQQATAAIAPQSRFASVSSNLTGAVLAWKHAASKDPSAS